MTRSIGYDVENLQKVAKSLSPQTDPSAKGTPPDFTNHILRISGDLLAMQGALRYLLETQSAAQQAKILDDMLQTMERVKGVKPTSTNGKKLQDHCLNYSKVLTDFLKGMDKKKA